MIAALKDFVPMTGNTHDLQNRRGPAGDWFLDMAQKVNPRIAGGATAQGFYVFSADGRAYAFNNNRSVERVLEFMGRGLAGYRAAPRVDLELEDLPSARLTPPGGTSVLRLYSRILPAPEGCHASNLNVQRDHLWVLASEAAALGRGEMPAELTARICRFALVDAVRGEPDFWAPSHVRRAEFRVVGNRIEGAFAMRTADGSRGIEGTLQAEFVVRGSSISSFAGYVDAVAWGEGKWTPNAPAGRFPIKFAIELATDAASAVSPQAAMYGAEYLSSPGSAGILLAKER